MENIIFDLWFTEDSFIVSGNSPWVKALEEKPIANLFDYLKNPNKIDNLGLDFLSYFCTEFLKEVELIDSVLLESNIKIELSDIKFNKIFSAVPLCAGSEYVNNEWIEYHWQQMEDWLYETIKDFEGSIESCLSSYFPSFNVADRTYFHLVETKNDVYPFGFLTSYTTKIDNQVKHMPLSYALKEFKGDEKELLHLLTTIFKASNKCEILSSIIEKGQLFDPIYLTVDEAFQLLKAADFFKQCGIGFRFPSWWKKKNKMHTQVTIGERIDNKLSLKSLLSVDLSFVIEGQPISKEELLKLLELKEGLIQFNGQWIEINHSKIMKLINQYDSYKEQYEDGITFSDFLQLNQEINSKVIDENEVVYESGTWLNSFKVHNPSEESKFVLNNKFKGTLRKYQQYGVSWLNQMLNYGFGACLADDMGLGKTIQVLAIISTAIENNYFKKVLLIVPSTLVENWISEKNKFTPFIDIFVLDKSEKELQEMDFNKKGIYITTYKMVSLRESINKEKWDLIILDEAQAIKNANAKQSKIIKQIESDNRIAMTGTPIENSLLDLWSIFDFINPGLLGGKKEFTNIIKKAKDNTQIYSSLRNVVEPFVLRRLKTDKNIIDDLPNKIERDLYIPLSSKQVTLYKKLISEVTTKIEDVQDIGKKGLILSTILKSKQICNHPSQYLKTSDFKESDSGKFIALKQLVEVIKEKHEKMLVFTQYKAMVEPLKTYLTSLFGYEGLSIDGSVSLSKRNERVKAFNSDKYYPFMVITIKAGGTGLNLTSANHVVHFDRWWNPAVENQATDRAFRIGQKKVVNVYKFICKKTVEDKINELINSKKELSSKIIGETEESTVSWITKLDDNRLKEFFSYSD